MRPYADLSKEELLKMKDENKAVGSTVALINYELRQRELEENIRTLTKPHWTLVPIFWLSIASIVIALLAYFRPTQSDAPNNQHMLSSSPAITMMPSSPTGSTPKKSLSQNKHAPAKP